MGVWGPSPILRLHQLWPRPGRGGAGGGMGSATHVKGLGASFGYGSTLDRLLGCERLERYLRAFRGTAKERTSRGVGIKF